MVSLGGNNSSIPQFNFNGNLAKPPFRLEYGFAVTISFRSHKICPLPPCHPKQHVEWTSCQKRKIAGVPAPGMPRTFSLSPQVSDPDMHHGTCVTHVPWCMPGSLTSGFLWNRRRGETFPAFPAHAQPAILPIWLEAHSWEAGRTVDGDTMNTASSTDYTETQPW